MVKCWISSTVAEMRCPRLGPKTSSVAAAANESKRSRLVSLAPAIVRFDDSEICRVPMVMVTPAGIVTVRAAVIVNAKTATSSLWNG
jgi:hypothetical protein